MNSQQKIKQSVLVVLSGGQDSTTCLFLAKSLYETVHAITFDYGQRHRIEIESAIRVAALAGVASHEVVQISGLKGTSPLTDHTIPVEQYADAQSLPGGIEKTFVPMRNTLFFTYAANLAVVLGCEVIMTGVAEADSGGYPDCEEGYLTSLEATFNWSLRSLAKLAFVAPLMHLSKAKTVELAVSVPGALDALAYSHTCYNGVFPPCGHCHACLLRERGFVEAGVVDPLQIRAAGYAAPYTLGEVHPKSGD